MVTSDPILPLFIIHWKVLSGLTILMNNHQLMPFANLTYRHNKVVTSNLVYITVFYLRFYFESYSSHIHSENLHHIQEYEFVFRGARKGPASAATSVKMKQKRGFFLLFKQIVCKVTDNGLQMQIEKNINQQSPYICTFDHL